MSTNRFTPARLLTTISLVLTLVAGMFVATTVGPTTRLASAVVSAARAGNALAVARPPRPPGGAARRSDRRARARSEGERRRDMTITVTGLSADRTPSLTRSTVDLPRVTH